MRIATPFTESELEKIDDWGFARRIRNRSDIVRELVLKGIEPAGNEKGAEPITA